MKKKVATGNPMIVQITNKAYRKLRYFVEECDTEISGLGKVRPIIIEREVPLHKNKFFNLFGGEDETELVEENAYEIYDVEILPQVVSGVHATLNEEDLAKFLHDKIRRGAKVADYKLWWHSHVNMSAFFSGTDTATIDASTEFPYLISLVTNKQGDVLTRFDIFKPQRITVDAELEVQEFEDGELRDYCRRQIERKVKLDKSAHFLFDEPAIIPGHRHIPDLHDEYSLDERIAHLHRNPGLYDPNDFEDGMFDEEDNYLPAPKRSKHRRKVEDEEDELW